MKAFLARHYRKLALLSLVFTVTTVLSGCGLPQWIQTAQSILPIAAQMALAILTLIGALAGKTIDAGQVAMLNKVVGRIQAGLNDVSAMVTEYQSNPSTTLLGSIQAGTQAVITNISQFLGDTGITDEATRAKIVAVLELILNEVTAFQSLLPLFVAQHGEQVTITVPWSAKDFKAQYNAIIESMTGTPAVDAALSHLHKL